MSTTLPRSAKRWSIAILLAGVILLGGCNPLLAIYLYRTREYDEAREVVALAQSSKKWIAPEYLAQLKAASANQ